MHGCGARPLLAEESCAVASSIPVFKGGGGGSAKMQWQGRFPLARVILACAGKGVERRVGVCHWACLPA
jgi:hypothetical protein